MITKIKQIDSKLNPADMMIKEKACNTLRDLINFNRVNLSIKQWVERTQELQSVYWWKQLKEREYQLSNQYATCANQPEQATCIHFENSLVLESCQCLNVCNMSPFGTSANTLPKSIGNTIEQRRIKKYNQSTNTTSTQAIAVLQPPKVLPTLISDHRSGDSPIFEARFTELTSP